MKTIIPTLLALQLVTTVHAEEDKMKFETLLDYKNVTVTKVEPDGIRIVHESGVAKIQIEKLPEEIRTQLGLPGDAAKEHREMLQDSVSPLLEQDTLEREIAKAAAIVNSVERLASFDEIALRHKLAPATNTEISSKGKWNISIDKSPLDDSQTVVGIIDADSSVKIGFETETPTLIVRYKEGELEAYINYQSFLGSDTTDVTTRFGKEQPKTEEWTISTDHKAIFVPGDKSAFIKKLKALETLVVRVTPHSESPVTISFTATGIEAVIDAIKQASGKK